MNRIWLLVAPLLGFLMATGQTTQNAQTAVVAFRNVTLIDGTGSPAKRGTTIVISSGRIAQIGRDGKVKIPAGARIVDGSGKFAIPGLWDMHVHAFDKNNFLPLFIANGVTGVRDMFGQLGPINQWRKEMKEGTLIGPQFVAAGPIIDGPKPVWQGSIGVSNAEEGVAAVKKVKEGGSDFVKVYSLLPRDAYFAIAAEAKRQGMAFAGHVPSSVTAGEASDAGQASIEHLTGVLSACSSKEDEIRREMLAGTPQATRFSIQQRVIESYDQKKAKVLFAQFVKNGTWMCPTITVLRAIASVGDETFRNDPRLVYIPGFLKLKTGMWGENAFGLKNRSAEDNGIAKRVFEKQLEILRDMHNSGVKFIAGTDVPNPYVFPGFSLHDELELLVKVGLSPMEALKAATSDAARFLGKLDQVGTIENGKLADLVLLDANPLVEIGNTRKIAAVMVGGRLIERSELDAMLSKVETANK